MARSIERYGTREEVILELFWEDPWPEDLEACGTDSTLEHIRSAWENLVEKFPSTRHAAPGSHHEERWSPSGETHIGTPQIQLRIPLKDEFGGRFLSHEYSLRLATTRYGALLRAAILQLDGEEAGDNHIPEEALNQAQHKWEAVMSRVCAKLEKVMDGMPEFRKNRLSAPSYMSNGEGVFMRKHAP